VREIVTLIAGEIVPRLDPVPPVIRTYLGSMANVLRVSMNGRQYIFAYDHKGARIVVREENGFLREFINGSDQAVRDFFSEIPVPEPA
jgi:hypothetical protein